jgi:hypothetical protein
VQHPWADVHDWPVFLHSGRSQKQTSPGAPVHGMLRSDASTVRQLSPVQQLASVVHGPAMFEQVGAGGPQTPPSQTSVALQQGIVAEQA